MQGTTSWNRLGKKKQEERIKIYSTKNRVLILLMKKIHFILILSFLSIHCFSQKGEAFNFDLYRTLGTDLIIDLTQQDNIIHDKQFENVSMVLARKEETHLGYFRFKLDKEINSAEISSTKTVLRQYYLQILLLI